MVARATSGSIITARANPPASALWWLPHPTTGSLTFTSSANTKMPITIDGNPFRTSSHSRTWSPIRGGANSLTKMAVNTPNGRAISVAIATRIRLPTRAGATPPPEPKSTGPFVKKSRLSACTPREKTDQTRTTSTAIAASAAARAASSASLLTSSLRRARPVAFRPMRTS